MDEFYEIHEETVGMYQMDSTTAEALCKAILDVLTRINLAVQNCRGQDYDGASAMSGEYTGVAKQSVFLLWKQERCLLTVLLTTCS